MNRNFLRRPMMVFAMVLLSAVYTHAQTTLQSKIAAPDDDQEEWLPGSKQTKTAGDLDAGSSDLEFGTENKGSDPQIVGMRFTKITIPKGSTILSAYIQFTVDATAKNTDPCVVAIRTEDNDNPVTFDPTVKKNITSRPKGTDSVVWTVTGTTWGTVGSAGEEQRTPDLKALVQKLIDRAGWASGNAMAFFINGSGTREVESADDEASKAAVLVVEYKAPGSSIEEMMLQNLLIYPNPAHGNILLDCDNDLHYKLTDILGRTVISGNKTREKVHTVDVSTLKAGLYILEATDGLRSERKEIVIR